MAENNNEFGWEHIITVSPEDEDLARDIVSTLCERYHLDMSVSELENGDIKIGVFGPDVITTEVAKEYYREYT